MHQLYFEKQEFPECIPNMFETIILLAGHQSRFEKKQTLSDDMSKHVETITLRVAHQSYFEKQT